MEIQNQPHNNNNIFNHYNNTFLKRWNIELLDFHKKKEYKNIQMNL